MHNEDEPADHPALTEFLTNLRSAGLAEADIPEMRKHAEIIAARGRAWREAIASDRYGRTPVWLFEYGMSPFAIALFGLLSAKYANREGIAFPSLRTLQDDLGIARMTVIKALRELVTAGALTKTHRLTRSGYRQNVYQLQYRCQVEGPTN